MRESLPVAATAAIGIRGTSIPRGEHPFPSFILSVRAIWPRKTAAHLAARAHVTERAAKFWLAGDRDPSAEAFRVVVDEIMRRRRRKGS